MTSLLPRPTSGAARSGRGRPHGPAPAPGRRPLALLAAGGGAAAALLTMLLTGSLGVIGWFLTDSGSHGTAGDGLRAGAQAWLVGLGSGVHVQGVALTLVPLGVTVLSAVTIARLGHRVGEACSGHGPDADALADGERDWTVPVAAGLFTVGYLVVAVITASTASRFAGTDLGFDVARIVLLGLLLCLGVGGTAIAVGSGRAAVWAAAAPPALRASALVARSVLRTWLLVALLAFVAAFALDVRTAANIMSQLHTGPGDVVLMLGLGAAVLPNAVLFSSAYLLGPGFTVGTGTLVAPSGVVLGPLPMLPIFAALPDVGTPPAWVAGLLGVPALVAFVATLRALRHVPLARYEEGAVRGLGGGLLAALALGVLTAFAGGAIGPGRMRDVAPHVGDALLHAIVSFGLAGLLAGLIATWWQRRQAA